MKSFEMPRTGRHLRILFCLAVFLTACRPPTPTATHFYNGPTDPMATVVADINQNSGKIPSLYATLDYQANIVDPKTRRVTSVSGDGSLLFRRPQSLLLRGNKDLVGEVFAIGSNDAEFWLKIGGDVDTTWWGHYANLGKPGCEPMPIRPDLILEILGIGLFNTDFLQQPVPVMRFDNDEDVYRFDWNVRGINRWMTLKEISYDRATHVPREVRLYDPDGRAILTAKLSDAVPLPVPGLDKSQWPLIAGKYDLLFPDTGSSISFHFSEDYATQHKGYPKPTSFRRPQPDTKNVNQVDAHVEEENPPAAMP